jgi:excinuclease ABC subunit B
VAVIAGLEKRMREAAADLEFETAARLRDEIKRLRETELAVADDPLARQTDVEDRAGAFAGERKYGRAPRETGSDPSRARSDRSRTAGGEGSDPAGTSRIQREYRPVQPTYAQSSTIPGTRARKPTLDDMGSAANRPIPARTPNVDPRARAGAYGEHIRGPHKPTLDEMGPHAERGLPVRASPSAPASPATPATPSARSEGRPDPLPARGERELAREKGKHRHGRPRKTGRPGA